MTDNANGRPSEETAAQQVGETETIVPPTADVYADRLAEAVDATMARRTAQKAVRAEMAARRSYGLAARHSAKRRR